MTGCAPGAPNQTLRSLFWTGWAPPVPNPSGRYLEFNARGVNKGAGLLRLAAALGVDPSETIAIGDNWNDWPMIRDAALGVAVANAVEDMKPQCDYVCTASCNENAVAEVIGKFVLA